MSTVLALYTVDQSDRLVHSYKTTRAGDVELILILSSITTKQRGRAASTAPYYKRSFSSATFEKIIRLAGASFRSHANSLLHTESQKVSSLG